MSSRARILGFPGLYALPQVETMSWQSNLSDLHDLRRCATVHKEGS